MAADMESVLARADELAERVAEKTNRVREQRAARNAEKSETQAGVEAARRSGEQGRQWQLVQQRIDLGKTTMADVVNGVDHSPEAVAVRQLITKALPAARAQFAEQAEELEESGQLAAMQHAQARLNETVSQFDAINPNF